MNEISEITASDISKKALVVAKINAKNNNAEIEFIEADLFNGIDKKFNIIVSNPPYIKTDVINELSLEVQNEPHVALDGGQDGLDFYRNIINNAYKYLVEDGYLALEIGYDQKQEVVELIENSHKYKDIYSKKDLAGNDRIVICKRR
ncbi:MAG: peptide chain release factor N(5)-glutamine methyltransferase [Clostridia bacterium]|nr:peptide chain release factor N(5)-glutamine methyltransferase [Clostridia bacterium]